MSGLFSDSFGSTEVKRKSHNDGENAFPHEGVVTNGMTLRDYFAANALQGMLAARRYYPDEEKAVARCYAIADAMLLGRAK